MKAETITPSYCYREMFPIINIAEFLGKAVGLPVRVPTTTVSVNKDNAGALILAKTLPPKFTPHSNATKTI